MIRIENTATFKRVWAEGPKWTWQQLQGEESLVCVHTFPRLNILKGKKIRILRSESSSESGKTCLGVGLRTSIMAASWVFALLHLIMASVSLWLLLTDHLSGPSVFLLGLPSASRSASLYFFPKENRGFLSLKDDSVWKGSTHAPTTPFGKIKIFLEMTGLEEFLSCNCREQKYGSEIIFLKSGQWGDGEMA